MPIKINFTAPMTQEDLLKTELEKAGAQATPVCYYPAAHKVTHGQRWAAVNKKMAYSKWKLNAVAQAIRGKSLLEAKNILRNVDKKGA